MQTDLTQGNSAVKITDQGKIGSECVCVCVCLSTIKLPCQMTFFCGDCQGNSFIHLIISGIIRYNE